MYTQISPSDLGPGAAAGTVPHQRTVGLRDLVPFLRSNWWIIVLSCVFFVGTALLYILNTPPSYVARAQLITRMYAEQPGDQPSNLPDDAVIEGQIEVIKSDDVLRSTIRELNLLDDPELAAQSPTVASIIRSWLATASSADLQAMLAFNPAKEMETSTADKERFLIAVMRGRLWVRRVGQSSVLDIAFNSSDPEKAATIANAIARSYIAKDVESKSSAATQAADWLSGRLSELREQVFASDRAVEQFKVQGDGSQTAGGQFKLSELQSVADTYRKVYEGFLERWAETRQRISYPVSDARFVTQATAPLTKTEPKSTIIMAFAALLGIVAGTAIASVRQAMNRRISSLSDIAKGTDLPCLGAVSLVPVARSNPEKSPPIPIVAVRRAEASQQKPAGSRQKSRAVLLRDFRELKATLAGLCHQRKISVIGIVGIHGASGTTTVAANLALLHAASGSRTLLIDTCASNPTVSRCFAPEGAKTLSELLTSADPYSLLKTDQQEYLTVLPVGPFDDGASPGDRLSSQRASLSLANFKKWFDITIVDLPALKNSADARAVAPLLDAVVLVARAGVTKLDGLEEGIDALQNVGGRIVGIVLNAVPGKQRQEKRKA